MNELDLHRFLSENDVDMRWDGDVLSAWLHPYDIEAFSQLIGEGIVSEGGIDCNLQSYGTLWLDLAPICKYHGIDPERIHPKTYRL